MLIDLSHLGLLQIAGVGASKLLQGQLTCDLADITPTASRLAAHCNPQGRMLSLFRLFYWQDTYYFLLPHELLPTAQAALAKYAPFFNVTMTDVSDRWQVRRYQGDSLSQHVTTPPDSPDAVISTDTACIIRLPHATCYDIIGEKTWIDSLPTVLSEPLQADPINAWKASQIAQAIPTIYASTSGKLLPHDINLPELHGVSFTKGCYTGQEIIARMHYRGQRKKYLYRARAHTTTLPEPGSDIYHDNACGTVVDSCRGKGNDCQLLVIAMQSDVETKQLFLDPDKRVPLESLTLPY